MGLPNKWTHSEYGVCLSLWAAIDYLTRQGVTGSPARVAQKNAIDYTRTTGEGGRINAVHITPGGWVYPVAVLDTVVG